MPPTCTNEKWPLATLEDMGGWVTAKAVGLNLGCPPESPGSIHSPDDQAADQTN